MQTTLRHAIALIALASLGAAGADVAAADYAAGKQLFDRHCAECHAPGVGHPGTQQLGWTRGEDRAVLEQRSDLPAAYIIQIVRNGLLEMPAVRPTELTDAELRQLAEYLARPRKSRKVR
jgi:(+)-pinoresinol hydroxylase